MIRAATDSPIGHVQIQATGFEDSPNLEHLMKPRWLRAAIAVSTAQEGVVGASARLVAGGLISSKSGGESWPLKPLESEGVVVVGVDQKLEATENSAVRSCCASGGFLAAHPPEGEGEEIVLGKDLAAVLDVKVGDQVVVSSSNRTGPLFGAKYKVVGIIATLNSRVNRTLAFIHLARLSREMDAAGCASYVLLAVEDPSDPQRVASRTSERFQVLGLAQVAKVRSWQEIAKELVTVVKLGQGSLLATLVLAVMVVAVIVANVMTMAAMERTREFGIRPAHGEPPTRIAFTLILEAVLLALFS